MLRIALVCSSLLPLFALAQPAMEPGPKSPAESLKCLKPRPGFTVELMASEPAVMDPIAFAWGPDGKFWVVEMGDYPLGSDGKGKFGGRVKFLEKTKPDGPYDKATIFLDNLGFPTGVFPWGKGVLVTCAPDIVYAEDTDGDGKADKKEVLYTGFHPGNQQHRVNGLAWGLDNWIYGANGDSGGKVKSMKTGAVVDIRGRDFRIKPDEGLIEAVSGQTQFGRARDDWGNWFGNNNSNPMFHFVLEDRYLKRNPHLPYPDVRVQVSEKPGAAPVFPISKPLARFNNPQSLNHFTSACSTIVYRDNLFGKEFEGNAFISEPVHNLVHREVMRAEGVTFRSKRAADEEKSEFLVSSDNWFRPAMIQVGPDGALWVADMYRYVIEHPEWIPKEWQKKLDLRAGHDLGRIYRVYPEGAKPRPIPNLTKLVGKELVAALDSPSGWQRDMVQMLIVRYKDKKARGFVHRMALEHANPLARLHALCLFDGTGWFDHPLYIEGLLTDKVPGIRRHAVRLSEELFAEREAGFERVFQTLVNETDPQVRMQIAYTLGHWDSPKAAEMLAKMALKDHGDRHLLAALLSSLHGKNYAGVVEAALRHTSGPLPRTLLDPFLRLDRAHGTRRTTTILLGALVDSAKGKFSGEHYASLAGMLEALEQEKSSLSKLFADGDEELRKLLGKLSGLFDAARATAVDAKAAKLDQLLALRLLGRGLDRQEDDFKILEKLLLPQQSDVVQAAVVTSVSSLPHRRVPDLLLLSWRSHPPTLRGQVLDVLLSRDDGLKALLNRIEQKRVLPMEMDAARRQRLLEHKDVEVRRRAEKLLAGSVNADRKKVVETYRPALKLQGDAGRGAKIFLKNCATCHKLGGVGTDVGPDLASVKDKSPEGLLNAILDPNAAVEPRYLNYLATTKAGRNFSGLLSGETSTSITIVGVDGKAQQILRKDLDELTSTGKSTMPEGLEKDVSLQDVADLLRFVSGQVEAKKEERR